MGWGFQDIRVKPLLFQKGLFLHLKFFSLLASGLVKFISFRVAIGSTLVTAKVLVCIWSSKDYSE